MHQWHQQWCLGNISNNFFIYRYPLSQICNLCYYYLIDLPFNLGKEPTLICQDIIYVFQAAPATGTSTNILNISTKGKLTSEDGFTTVQACNNRILNSIYTTIP
jgi:hypothetical protein